MLSPHSPHTHSISPKDRVAELTSQVESQTNLIQSLTSDLASAESRIKRLEQALMPEGHISNTIPERVAALETAVAKQHRTTFRVGPL